MRSKDATEVKLAIKEVVKEKLKYIVHRISADSKGFTKEVIGTKASYLDSRQERRITLKSYQTQDEDLEEVGYKIGLLGNMCASEKEKEIEEIDKKQKKN